MKKVIVTRLGAIGDMVICTPIFPLLKKDGWHVTLHTTDYGKQLLKYNPYIDAWKMHDNKIGPTQLEDYFKVLTVGYDRHINLCETLEGRFLKVHWRDDYFKSKEELDKECAGNYYDYTLEVAGYPDVKGKNGELHFSPLELEWARDFIKKTAKGRYFILWSLSGSAIHKAYPYAEDVSNAFCQDHRDVVIVTVGDQFCELIEWEHPQVINRSGKLNIRKVLALTKYADLVVGSETGILNAAACFDTPKVIMLSHSSVENLTKYWTNCTNLVADVPCAPCHKLHYDMTYCTQESETGGSICMAGIKPHLLYEAIEKNYKEKRGAYVAA